MNNDSRFCVNNQEKEQVKDSAVSEFNKALAEAFTKSFIEYHKLAITPMEQKFNQLEEKHDYVVRGIWMAMLILVTMISGGLIIIYIIFKVPDWVPHYTLIPLGIIWLFCLFNANSMLYNFVINIFKNWNK